MLDLRCIFPYFRSRLSDSLCHHLIHDVQTSFSGAGDGFLDDRTSQTMNLNVHLDGSDTLVCTGYLKVHIAKEVFQALDIGQYDIIVICISGHQTTGNTCYRTGNGHTCCHQGHGRCADRCLRCRTIGFKCLRYSTDCIWEYFLAWQYRQQCTLCQCAMSDLTTTRTTAWFGLTYRVGREVIVMHISLRCFIDIQTIDLLYLRQRCQCTHIADLGLSTGEHSRTMYSGNQIHFCCQRTDFCDGTSIRSLVIFQDHLADGLLLELIQRICYQLQPLWMGLFITFTQLCVQLVHILLSGLLVICKDSHFHLLRCDEIYHILVHIFRYLAAGIGKLLLAAFCHDGVDERNDLFVHFMCLEDCLDHHILGNLIGTSLDHDDLLSGGSNGQL